jgi:glycosyltransferase involved in cell wall biosynthesis
LAVFVTTFRTEANNGKRAVPRGEVSPGRKRHILMFGYVPPPWFGPAVAYGTLLRSPFVEEFDVTFINLSVVSDIRGLGKLRLTKLLKLVKFFFLELWYLLSRRFDFYCHPISYNRNALLKDLALIRLARVFRVPTVLWMHGAGFQRFRATLPPRLRRHLDQTTGEATAVLVLADCLRGDFEGLLPAERIQVVTIGIEPQVDPSGFKEGRQGARILYLGGLAKTKGIFDLFACMPFVLARRPDARLVMAGQWFLPNEQAEGEQYIRDHNLGDMIQFLGPVHGQEKWDTLQSADLLVFPPPAQLEAFGIVLLEAMQAGLPIVATRGGARDEIIADGVNGLLADECNPRDLAEKILRLLADPDLRQRMGSANRLKFQQHYTHEQFGRRMIQVFNKLETFQPVSRQGRRHA